MRPHWRLWVACRTNRVCLLLASILHDVLNHVCRNNVHNTFRTSGLPLRCPSASNTEPSLYSGITSAQYPGSSTSACGRSRQGCCRQYKVFSLVPQQLNVGAGCSNLHSHWLALVLALHYCAAATCAHRARGILAATATCRRQGIVQEML
jgi:hypothetical protein